MTGLMADPKLKQFSFYTRKRHSLRSGVFSCACCDPYRPTFRRRHLGDGDETSWLRLAASPTVERFLDLFRRPPDEIMASDKRPHHSGSPGG